MLSQGNPEVTSCCLSTQYKQWYRILFTTRMLWLLLICLFSVLFILLVFTLNLHCYFLQPTLHNSSRPPLHPYPTALLSLPHPLCTSLARTGWQVFLIQESKLVLDSLWRINFGNAKCWTWKWKGMYFTSSTFNLTRFQIQSKLLFPSAAGVNFTHYPAGSHLVAVDPNPNFKKFYGNNKKKFPNIEAEEIIQTTGG